MHLPSRVGLFSLWKAAAWPGLGLAFVSTRLAVRSDPGPSALAFMAVLRHESKQVLCLSSQSWNKKPEFQQKLRNPKPQGPMAPPPGPFEAPSVVEIMQDIPQKGSEAPRQIEGRSLGVPDPLKKGLF